MSIKNKRIPSLGRTGFILLKCSSKNGGLVSQVCCTSVCAALLMQNGHKPTWTCCLGWCGWVEHAGGSGLLRPSCETACEETTEAAGSRKEVCICSNPQRQASFVCVQGLRACFGLLVHWIYLWWILREKDFIWWKLVFWIPGKMLIIFEIFRHWKLAKFYVFKASRQ